MGEAVRQPFEQRRESVTATGIGMSGHSLGYGQPQRLSGIVEISKFWIVAQALENTPSAICDDDFEDRIVHAECDNAASK